MGQAGQSSGGLGICHTGQDAQGSGVSLGGDALTLESEPQERTRYVGQEWRGYSVGGEAGMGASGQSQYMNMGLGEQVEGKNLRSDALSLEHVTYSSDHLLSACHVPRPQF